MTDMETIVVVNNLTMFNEKFYDRFEVDIGIILDRRRSHEIHERRA